MKTLLNEKTYIPLGFALTIVGASFYFGIQFQKIEERLCRMERKMDNFRTGLSATVTNCCTPAEARDVMTTLMSAHNKK